MGAMCPTSLLPVDAYISPQIDGGWRALPLEVSISLFMSNNRSLQFVPAYAGHALILDDGTSEHLVEELFASAEVKSEKLWHSMVHYSFGVDSPRVLDPRKIHHTSDFFGFLERHLERVESAPSLLNKRYDVFSLRLPKLSTSDEAHLMRLMGRAKDARVALMLATESLPSGDLLDEFGVIVALGERMEWLKAVQPMEVGGVIAALEVDGLFFSPGYPTLMALHSRRYKRYSSYRAEAVQSVQKESRDYLKFLEELDGGDE